MASLVWEIKHDGGRADAPETHCHCHWQDYREFHFEAGDWQEGLFAHSLQSARQLLHYMNLLFRD